MEGKNDGRNLGRVEPPGLTLDWIGRGLAQALLSQRNS